MTSGRARGRPSLLSSRARVHIDSKGRFHRITDSSAPAVDVRFDHTIVPAIDKRASAEFFAEIFGLPAPVEVGSFLQVRLTDGRIFDFAEPGIEFPGQHFAFLVDDPTFDALVERLRAWGIDHWADPQGRHPGEVNHDHGGRGVYFCDPAGHYLEALTARYDGSSLS